MQEFGGKVAVITGTANPNGIGLAVARRLAGEGCRVVLVDLHRDAVEARAAELRSEDLDASALAADMGDNGSVQSLAAAVFERYAGVDILVLNHVAATGGPGHGLLNPDATSWELHARVNYLGFVYGIKAFVPRMIEAGTHGHVLATTSGAGGSGIMYGNGPYASTKAAIIAVMECLYGQLRDAQADIVPTLIFPGVTSTGPDPELTERTVEMLRANGLPATMTRPHEVADMVMEAIRHDSFWARHRDEAHGEEGDWVMRMYEERAAASVHGTPPDPYLWGPPSNVLGP